MKTDYVTGELKSRKISKGAELILREIIRTVSWDSLELLTGKISWLP